MTHNVHLKPAIDTFLLNIAPEIAVEVVLRTEIALRSFSAVCVMPA
ncbi:MAG: hypothetical protein WAR83_14025 [Flavobacteriales bacterium]